MLTRQDLLAFFQMHPGATNKDVAVAFEITGSEAATRTKQLINGGFVTRKVVGRTATKADIYGYWVNPSVTPSMSKKERVKTTVGERLDNDKPLPSGDITALISNLSQALAKQIAAQVVVDLQGQLQRELSGIINTPVEVPRLKLADLIQAPHKPEVLTHKTKLPKVGVTGLLPAQAGMIQQEFCDTFDITFWNDRSGSSTAQLKAMGIGCEAVFHHINHASHSIEETLKSVGAKIIRVPGGMSTLRDALTKYYVEVVK